MPSASCTTLRYGNRFAALRRCRTLAGLAGLAWLVTGCEGSEASCPLLLVTDPVAVKGAVLDPSGDPVLATSVTARKEGRGSTITCDTSHGSYSCPGDDGQYVITLVRGDEVQMEELGVRRDECGFVQTRTHDFELVSTTIGSAGSCPTDRLPLLATVDLRDQDMVDSAFSVNIDLPEGIELVTRELAHSERDGWTHASIYVSSGLDSNAPLTVAIFADVKEPWCVEGPQELGLCTLEVELTPVPGDEPCTYEPTALVFTADDVARDVGE